MKNLDLIKKYAPILYFDTEEPFFPVRIGVTIINEPSSSPSFRRYFQFDDENLDFIIEYAIYWDFDIQHLYELEHVWVFVSKDGSVIDCEASFHGRYMKGLLKDRSNLEETHVKLFSQPGKHAFTPILELFELIPDLKTCTNEEAGKRGLLITAPFEGEYETDDKTDELVQEYLKTYRFKPSMVFERYQIEETLFVSWKELHKEVPQRIKQIIKDIKDKKSNVV